MKRDDPEMTPSKESGSLDSEAGQLRSAGGAQQNTQRAEDAARLLARENSLVAEIGRTISSSLEIDEVYERFGKQVSELVPFDRIDIVTVDRDRDTMRVEYTFGIDVPASTSRRGYTRPLAGSVVDAIIRRQSGFRLVARNKDEVARQFPLGLPTFELGFRSAIWAPLTARGEPIGMLALMCSEPNSYAERHLKLSEQVAAQIAGAIASASLYANLKRADQVLRESQDQLVQAEKMSALGTLTAGIAHELNNPLMGILNLAQYCIRHTAKEDKLYQVVKDIERETDRSIGVVQKLLTFSRFEQQHGEGFQLDSLA